MEDRRFLVRTRLSLVIAAAAFGLACTERAPAPPPSTTLAPERVPAPVASAPPVSEAPAVEVSASPSVSPSVTPATAATASPSASPTADPAEAQRKQEQERIRAELAAAKARADSLTTAVNTECPDLKPGELRHPGAVAACARLRGEATQAVSQYEALKQQAAAAGVNPQ
jgi:hypothetical protein